MTPQPSKPDDCGIGGRIDLGALSGVDQGLVGERTDAQGGREFGAVLERHLLRRVEGVEAVLRTAALACPALTADGAPVEHDEVADLHGIDACANAFDECQRLHARAGRGTRR